MSRFAKKFRVLASLCVLMNFVTLFFPLIKRVQENYADVTWTPLDYIQSAMSKLFSFSIADRIELTDGQVIWIALWILLPLLLSIAAGVWGMVGSPTQKVSSILILAVLLLYAGTNVSIGNMWPEVAEGQSFCRGLACTLPLIFSGCAAVLSIAALASTPRKVKVKESSIPQVEEVKQQQVEAKYNIMLNREQEPVKQEQKKPVVHGVISGLTGPYAGADIPLPEGEFILLGRSAENHLVFEGQNSVSRAHCKIKWDAGRQKYIINDYSTKGTFANGSTDCLPQHLDLELEPGTTIALGDENNTFCLE